MPLEVLSNPRVLAFLAFGLGSLVGSFLNVVIARLPYGNSIVFPASHCPKCKTPIRYLHNIPVLSWLWLGGKCFACKQPISFRYPLVEIITGTLFAATSLRFGLSPSLPIAAAFVASLVVVTFVDLDIWEIPDEIVLYGLPLVLIARPYVFQVPWWSGVAGAFLGAGILLMVRWMFFALRGVEAMGMGDVKLLAFIGGFIGPGALVPCLTVASVSGSVAGFLLILVERFFGRQTETPEPEEDETWSEPPTRLRLGLRLLFRRRNLTFGVPQEFKGRTHVRLGWLTGLRSRHFSFKLMVGVFQDVPGWGHFEGFVFGRRPFLWFGPLVGARLPDVEVSGEDEPWEPPPTAVPFGPFLSLGAMAVVLFSPAFGHWAYLLGIR